MTKRDFIIQNTQLNNQLEYSRRAAKIALKSLEGMTTEQFSKGGDRRVRRLLAAIAANRY